MSRFITYFAVERFAAVTAEYAVVDPRDEYYVYAIAIPNEWAGIC